MAKAALYFKHLLDAPAFAESAAPAQVAGGGAVGGRSLLPPLMPTVDFAQQISTFVQRSGAILTALLFQAKGLHLRGTPDGAVYTCSEDEAKGTVQPAGKQQASATASGEGPWPTLFVQPQGAPLPWTSSPR